MDIADRCAILSNERINPRFRRAAHAIESSEPRKIAPLINRPAAAPNPPARIDHPTVGKHATAHRKSGLWHSHPTMPPIVPLSRAQLTGLFILTIKDSNSQALDRAHLWILWTIKHPMIYWDLHPRVVFVRARVGRLREDYSLETVFHFIKNQGQFDVSLDWTRRSALRRPSCSTSTSLNSLRSSTMLPFKARKNGGAWLGILDASFPLQHNAWLSLAGRMRGEHSLRSSSNVCLD